MMTTELLNKLGAVDPDNLVVGSDPPLRVDSAVIRKGLGSLKRGTILAKSSTDGKLVVLGSTAQSGETLEAYAVLKNDTDVPDDDDVTATIYIGGYFNINRITVASGYTMTGSDKDTLRKYAIEFTAALKY